MAQTPEYNLPSKVLLASPRTHTTGGTPIPKCHYPAARSSEQEFPRISRPVPLMRPSYDVVVIGSGYGGGVAASRTARSGKRVAVLELGKERWPGEYPSTTVDTVSELQITGNSGESGDDVEDVRRGSPTAMYHLIVGEGQNAFVAHGLGGTSLVNANIFLEADERTMDIDSAWPTELREKDALKKYYQRARNMLQPTPYPKDKAELLKLQLLQKQAETLGFGNKFYRPPQTTFFEDGLNNAGVEMKASTLSGQDCTGVNDGSKSSVLMNYLPDAWNWGAEIFCECEVRYIKKAPKDQGGYLIFFAWHGNNGNRAHFKDLFYNDLMWVHAKELCFLAAGTLGTTEILLRSKEIGLNMSNQVGQNMSGNGDILAFGYNTDEVSNSIGRERPPHDDAQNPVGPCITGVIDMRGPDVAKNVLDGFVLEEGAVPEVLGRLLQTMLELTPDKVYPPGKKSGYTKLRKLFAKAESRLVGPYSPGSSMNRTQVYLVMSHDSNQATLTLEGDRAYLKFEGVGRSRHVRKLNEFLARATHAIGGTFINSPFFSFKHFGFGDEQITVHPIGGANISFDGTGEGGATNHMGEVFTGDGDEVHEGLVCVDGSLIPCALGVNPFATITALAERSLDCLSKKYGFSIDLETENGRLDMINGSPKVSWPLTADIQQAQEAIADSADQCGVRFAEVMTGHMHVGNEIEDFEVAERTAIGSGSTARFYLSVDTFNMKNLISRSHGASLATGTFTCNALSPEPFMVLRGDVQFFSRDHNTPDTRNLMYRFDLVGTDGKILHFHGYKRISNRMAFSPTETWKATTTLYVTITKPDETLVACGKLHISFKDFGSELKGFGSNGVPKTLARLASVGKFLSYFGLQTASYFFSPLRALSYPAVALAKRATFPLIRRATNGALLSGVSVKVAPTEEVVLTSSDGVPSKLHSWIPTTPNPDLPPILFVPGASVDQQIFALPTIKTNAVEFFLKQGYRLYCVTHRVGKSETAKEGYKTYDARLDILAALEHIRQATAGEKIYCIAHCAGSIALSMGLLDGTIPASWLKGVTASQVFFNPRFAKVNMLKASSPLSLQGFYTTFAGDWFDTASSENSPMFQRFTDQLLRFYPVGGKGEMCNSTTCHRSELAFGRLWTHNQLNDATHQNLAAFVGGISMRTLSDLVRTGKSGSVSDNSGASLVTEENLARLEGLPILFLHGLKNAVFKAESTEESIATLRYTFGHRKYVERYQIRGYGHLDCWMGKNAYKDVYPRVLDHIEDVCRVDNESHDDLLGVNGE